MCHTLVKIYRKTRDGEGLTKSPIFMCHHLWKTPYIEILETPICQGFIEQKRTPPSTLTMVKRWKKKFLSFLSFFNSSKIFLETMSMNNICELKKQQRIVVKWPLCWTPTRPFFRSDCVGKDEILCWVSITVDQFLM